MSAAGADAYDRECMMDDKPKAKIRIKGAEVEVTLTKERQITRGKYKGTVEYTFVDDDGGEHMRYGKDYLEWKDFEKGATSQTVDATPAPLQAQAKAEPAGPKREPLDLKTLSHPDVRELAQMKDGGTFMDSLKRVWGRIGDRFTVASGEGDDAEILDNSVQRSEIMKLRKAINVPPMKGGAKAKK